MTVAVFSSGTFAVPAHDFTVTTANNDTLTSTSVHGLAVDDRVLFTNGDNTTGMPGLTEGIWYWVTAVPTTTTFKVSLTQGGATINPVSVRSGLWLFREKPLVNINVAGVFTVEFDLAAMSFTRSSAALADGFEAWIFKRLLTGGTKRHVWCGGFGLGAAYLTPYVSSIPISNDLTDADALAVAIRTAKGVKGFNLPWKVIQH